MSSFRCSSEDSLVPQFEMQVPKIIKHKYIEDDRVQTLIPFYEDGIFFANSSCIHAEETDNFLIFRGPLEGRDECQINHFVEFDDENLYDIYSGMVNYISRILEKLIFDNQLKEQLDTIISLAKSGHEKLSIAKVHITSSSAGSSVRERSLPISPRMEIGFQQVSKTKPPPSSRFYDALMILARKLLRAR